MCAISFSMSLCRLSMYVPWKIPGRNADCQFCDSAIGKPPGHITMKPGRFWFSVPRPYMSHEPRHGRACRASPQFISISDGS